LKLKTSASQEGRPEGAPGVSAAAQRAIFVVCAGAAVALAVSDALLPRVNLAILYSAPLIAYVFLARRSVPWPLALVVIALAYGGYLPELLFWGTAHDRTLVAFSLANRTLVAAVILAITGLSASDLWPLPASTTRTGYPNAGGNGTIFMGGLACAGLVMLLAFMDLRLPDQLNLSILYVLPLCICVWIQSRAVLWIITGLALGAVGVAFAVAHAHAPWPPFMLANRMLAAAAVLATALALHLRIWRGPTSCAA
jgi:hypothetical protein